jgi:hypothetical protein
MSCAVDLYHRGWWDDTEDLYTFCQDGPLKMKSHYFQRNPAKKMGGNTYTRDDLGWGLNVVRKHALLVFNNSTKSSFLSLVPYAGAFRSAGRGQFDSMPPRFNTWLLYHQFVALSHHSSLLHDAFRETTFLYKFSVLILPDFVR